MPRSISPAGLSGAFDSFLVIDVRKKGARLSSGLTIPGAVARDPSGVDGWRHECAGGRVVVFCVHGHEVSQTVCGFLADSGIDAVFIEGGFEAWREGGYPVALLGGPQ